jgi:hypothetical protein
MELRDVVLIVITPLALTLGSLAGSIRNRLDRRTDLGLRAPSARHWLGALQIFTDGLFSHTRASAAARSIFRWRFTSW